MASMYQLPFDQLLGYRDVLIEIPTWWFQVALGWLGAVGLLLWLFGRRLLQPGLGLVGLGVGAAVTLPAANAFALPNVHYWVIGGAVAGAIVLGLLLWRLVLALAVTLAVMVAAPWGVIAFNGWPLPAIGEPVAEAATEVREIIPGAGSSNAEADSDSESSSGSATVQASAAGEASDGSGEAAGNDASGDPDGESGEADSGELAASLDAVFEKAWGEIADNCGTWWSEDLSKSQRLNLLGTSIGGGVLALLLGLGLPGVMASLVTALIGAGLIYTALVALLPQALSGLMAPDQPRRIIIGLLAATLLGLLLQTVFLRQKAEA